MLIYENHSYRSTAEIKMAIHLEELGIPFENEYRFSASRRFRLDFALVDAKIGIEVEGITQAGGRHQRLNGFMKDCEKYNLAAFEGWLIFRIPNLWLTTAASLPLLQDFLRRLEDFLCARSSRFS